MLLGNIRQLLQDLAAMDQPFAIALNELVLVAPFGGHAKAVHRRAAGNRHPIAVMAGCVCTGDVDNSVGHDVVHDGRRIVGGILVGLPLLAIRLHVGDDFPDLVPAAVDLVFPGHGEFSVLGEGRGVDIGIEGIKAGGIAHQRRFDRLAVDVVLE